MSNVRTQGPAIFPVRDHEFPCGEVYEKRTAGNVKGPRAFVPVSMGILDQNANSVIVEHDPATITACEHMVELGPGSGEHGGEIVALGTPKQVMNSSQEAY